MKLKDVNRKLIFSYAFASIILTVMIVAACKFPSDNWMSLMMLIAGVSVGWVVGIVISPYTDGEKTKFVSYAKAIASFLSGYVVAHLNDLIKHVMKPEFLGNPMHLFQMILLFASCCISLVVVYVTRQYA